VDERHAYRHSEEIVLVVSHASVCVTGTDWDVPGCRTAAFHEHDVSRQASVRNLGVPVLAQVRFTFAHLAAHITPILVKVKIAEEQQHSGLRNAAVCEVLY
jgi:hypothetical protein